MKLVYAVDKISYNDKDHVGVVKKVESQMKLFNKNGIETSLCQYEWQGGYPQIQIEKDTDILYFRRIEPSVKMLCSLRRLKKKNSFKSKNESLVGGDFSAYLCGQNCINCAETSAEKIV